MRKINSHAESGSDFLKDLALWRNDPLKAQGILRMAKNGNTDAQYAVGLLYAEGRGIKQDESEAYYWLSRAVRQNDQDAKVLREIVQQQMSLDEINAVEERLNLENLDVANA